MDSARPVPGRRDRHLPDQRRVALRLASRADRRGAGARAGSPWCCSWALRGRTSSGPFRSATSARWPPGSGCCSRCGGESPRGDVVACVLLVTVARVLQPRDPVRDRRRRRDRHRARTGGGAPSSSSFPRRSTGSGTSGGGTRPRTTSRCATSPTAPLYVFNGIAAAISSLFGMATPRDESGVGAYDWGRPPGRRSRWGRRLADLPARLGPALALGASGRSRSPSGCSRRSTRFRAATRARAGISTSAGSSS